MSKAETVLMIVGSIIGALIGAGLDFAFSVILFAIPFAALVVLATLSQGTAVTVLVLIGSAFALASFVSGILKGLDK